MFKLSGNVLQSRDARSPSPHLRDDGTNFPYRMFFDENARIVDAEELSELIEQIIPGYLGLDDEGRLAARRLYASRAAFNLRVNVLAGVDSEVRAGLSDWEWEVLSSDEPLESVYPLASMDSLESEEDVDVLGTFWSSSVPLVLVEHEFFPVTDVVPPMSALGDTRFVDNLIWFWSESEKDFLDSLMHVGVLTYGSPRVAPTPSLR